MPQVGLPTVQTSALTPPPLDPRGHVRKELMERATAALDIHGHRITRRDRMYLVDFKRYSGEERLYEVDLVGGHVTALRTCAACPQMIGPVVTGLPVLSPAHGQVVRVCDHLADNPPGEVDTKNNWGNFVLVRLDSGPRLADYAGSQRKPDTNRRWPWLA